MKNEKKIEEQECPFGYNIECRDRPSRRIWDPTGTAACFSSAQEREIPKKKAQKT